MRNCDFYKTRQEADLAFAIDCQKTGRCNDVDSMNSWLFEDYAEKKPELIAHTSIFDLMKGVEVQPNFRPVQIKSKDWVSVIIEMNKKFLMTKQLRYGLMKELTEFPCGMVEENETPFRAAQRELREETGYDIELGRLQHIGSYAANPAFMTNTMHYFYADISSGGYSETTTSFDEHEVLSSFWQDKHDVQMNLFKDPSTSVFMAAALMLLNEKKVFAC